MFLLNAISPDTLATAAARLIDTLIGGAIGLVGLRAVADVVARAGLAVGSATWSRPSAST